MKNETFNQDSRFEKYPKTEESPTLPIAEDGMQMDYEFFLLGREGASLEVRSEVVYPP